MANWISTTSGDWYDGANWDTGTVPGTADDITIAPFSDSTGGEITISFSQGNPEDNSLSLFAANGGVLSLPGLIQASGPGSRIDFPATTANGGAISLADNGTPEDPTDDSLIYNAPDGFTGTDSFAYTVTNDFGLTATATVSVTVSVRNGSISGTKFQDDNGNGVQEDSEDVISGVTIFLDADNDGELDSGEQSVVTDADGNYIFTDLEPGTYIVREVVPDGFTQTSPSGGGLVGDGFADVVLEYFDSGAGPIGPSGGIGSNFPIPVSLDVVLGDEPSEGADFLSLPTGSFVTVGFTDETVVDGPGNDIIIPGIDSAGEDAEVWVSSNLTDFTFLGRASQDIDTSLDLASIAFTEPVQAVRIIGLDNRGRAPGFDVFNVQVSPQSLGSGNHVVTIDAGENVEDLDFGNIANQSPVAVDDAGVITEVGTPVTIDVLSNDFDPDGNPISLLSFGATTTNGRTVSRDDNNTPDDLTDDSVIYSPPEDFAGTDTITYTISDGLGGADIGNVNITVAGDNFVNGSFEEGLNPGSFLTLNSGSTDIVGWTVTRDTIDYNGTILLASDGSRSIDLDGSPGFGGIAQTFSTTPGQDYLVTFDFAGNAAGPPTIKQMRVEAAGQSADFSFDITGRSLFDVGWQPQNWQFTAVDTSTTIEFFSLNTEGGLHGPTIDNVSVVPNADGPPDITVNIAPGATPREEGPTNGTYIISLSDPVSNEGLILDYTVTGSATRDADYSLSAGAGVTNITGNQIILEEGSTSATVNLIPITDAITDPEETVRLAITASPRYQVGSNNSATLSITDSEGGIEPPPPPPSDEINLDIDGNGETDALTDGSLAIRYLFQFRGDILINNVIGVGATRTTALEITNYLDLAQDTMLDVDGNGMADALTDGLMIIRYLFGFGANAVIDGAIGPNATRTTADAIIAHLESFDL